MLTLILFFGCAETVNATYGFGGSYRTLCSATMEASGDAYTARCTPAACDDLFRDLGVNHVVVSVDPGVKVVGYAERVCMQDLNAGAPAKVETTP